jgi:DNA-binding NarL/FixJ family response regulator
MNNRYGQDAPQAGGGPAPAGPAPVIGLAADLLFASRMRAAGQAAGVAVATVGTPEELVRRVRAERPRLVLVDLELRRGDPAAAIAAMVADREERGGRIVAFASHMNAAALQAGRAAGADRVLARSAFVRELPDLLREVAAGGDA